VNEYEFWAIQDIGRASIKDRYRLDAETFGDACAIAQYNENENAAYERREPATYNEFKQII
jgi:hypothetical protein